MTPTARFAAAQRRKRLIIAWAVQEKIQRATGSDAPAPTAEDTTTVHAS